MYVYVITIASYRTHTPSYTRRGNENKTNEKTSHAPTHEHTHTHTYQSRHERAPPPHTLKHVERENCPSEASSCVENSVANHSTVKSSWVELLSSSLEGEPPKIFANLYNHQPVHVLRSVGRTLTFISVWFNISVTNLKN